jgi:hypothetical protein
MKATTVKLQEEAKSQYIAMGKFSLIALKKGGEAEGFMRSILQRAG